MKTKKTKRLALLGVALILFVAGCGEKKTVNELESEVQALQEENQQLRNLNDGMAITEHTVQSSLQTLEGSNIPEFVTIDQKIVFPNLLNIPGSADDVNNSHIQVGSRLTLTPSNNWMARVNGSTIHFAHPSKIWGSVKAVKFDYMDIQPDQYRAIIQAFFKDFPTTNITYRKVYMGDWESGLLARADITVDKKPHVVNVGFVISGNNAVLFLYDYEDNQTGVQQELVDLLISSVKDGSIELKLE